MSVIEKLGNTTTLVSGHTKGLGGLTAKIYIDSQMIYKDNQVKIIEDKIDVIDKKLIAVKDLETRLIILKATTDALRGPDTYGINAESDVFNAAKIYLNTIGSEAAPQVYANAIAHVGAKPGVHTLTITTIAVEKSQITGTFTSTTADATVGGIKFTPGTFQINGVDVIIASGDNLDQINYKINAQNPTTKVSSEILKISSSNYKLVMKSDKPGIDNQYTITDAGGVLTSAAFVVTAAVDSVFVFDGETISRSANEITDLLNGDALTINLFQITPVAPVASIKITVALDDISIVTAIEEFIKAHNDLRIFIAKQNERNAEGLYVEEAVLHDVVETNIITDQAFLYMSASVTGIASADKKTFAELGIKYYDSRGDAEGEDAGNNLIVFNPDKTLLETTLINQPEQVRRIFQFDFIANSPDIRVFKRSNQMYYLDNKVQKPVTTFTIDIDTSRADLSTGQQDKVRLIHTATGITYNPRFETFTSYSQIDGYADTPFSGLVLAYTGDGTDSVSVTMTQGIADRLYLFLNDETTTNTIPKYKKTGGVYSYDSDGNRELFEAKTNSKGNTIENYIEQKGRVLRLLSNLLEDKKRKKTEQSNKESANIEQRRILAKKFATKEAQVRALELQNEHLKAQNEARYNN